VSSLELRFEGVLPGPPRRNVEEIARCLGWSYEGVEAGWHVLAIPLDVPLLKAPKVYIREEPGRYVGRGAVPAGELTFEIRIERVGGTYRWVFQGIQRGAINMLGRQFFESLAGRIVERVAACL
jgi:hypothetical protein